MTRLNPPGNGSAIMTVNGRTYDASAGPVTVPDFDAAIMVANGWMSASDLGAGVTSVRPLSPTRDDTFLDTTLGKIIQFDGLVWRDPATGAAV